MYNSSKSTCMALLQKDTYKKKIKKKKACTGFVYIEK